jgi:diguanylate cyclase (GGDEF)-like protein/PAS domain S-box-containing protein
MDATFSLKVSDIMSRPVRTVGTDCTLTEIARQMSDARISSMLVMSDQSLLGIITERDLLRMLNARMDDQTPVTEFMSKSVITVSPDTDFDDAYSIAINHQVRHLVVIDELRLVVGLVCETDFRRHLDQNVLRQLDELNVIMDRDLPMLEVHESLGKALNLMQTDRTTYVLVVENKRPVGIFTERDIPKLLGTLNRDIECIRIDEVMNSPVRTVSQRTPIFEVVGLMQELRYRHIVVVDSSGQTVGMVTQHKMLERISIFLTQNKLLHLEGSKRISENLLNMAAEASRLGFLEFNLINQKTQFSLPLLKELGLAPEEANPIQLSGWIERVHPDDRVQLKKYFQIILQGEQATIDLELRIMHKGGQWVWMQIRGRIVEQDESGKPKVGVVTVMNVTQRKEAEEKMRRLAFFDVLTGLPNRSLLLDRLGQALSGAMRSGIWGALLLIDLDNFKTINDTLGHEAGDLLLQETAQRLNSCLGEGDTLARLGGDEFVVMLTDLGGDPLKAAETTEIIGEKIRRVIDRPFDINPGKHRCLPSIGATLFDGREFGVEDLMKQIEIAMYQAKKSGGNRMYFFDVSMQQAIEARAVMEAELRHAIADNKELMLFYQPQVDLSGRLLGVEALLRWKHPKLGLVSPAQFIPLAEENGLILPLGNWVLAAACQQLAAWAKKPETAQFIISVNVSVKQLHLASFVDDVMTLVEHFAIPPEKLKLEITESMLLNNVDDIIAKMNLLKTRKISFSMDDFGTGYSSLQYLRRLPLDQLKIDQAFVREIVEDDSGRAIVRTIIAMANSLNLSVIAEGVETETQQQILQAEGCNQYQGYLFGKPLPLTQFESLFKINGHQALLATSS